MVEAEDERTRLDRFLTDHDSELSRSRVQQLIDEGKVTVNGSATKSSRKLSAGDVVDVLVPEPSPPRAEAENIALDVVFEDEHLIVVNKRAGMVVHPAPGHPSGTLVNALLHHCTELSGIGGELRPGIVHRIDKDTSGVMLATKSDAAHQAMALQFQQKAPEREYLAIVAPGPKEERGVFDTLHGRHPKNRKKFSSRVTQGKKALTHYRVLERLGHRAASVVCRLETGRTHQIRVHFADAGMALLGDPMYGRRRAGELGALADQLGRQALHARLLAFIHPVTGVEVRCESPLPDDMLLVLDALRAASA